MQIQLATESRVVTSRHEPLEDTGLRGPHGVRRMKLTDKLLKSLTVEPGKKDRMVFDAECPGMAVRITVAGTRSFIVQWTDPSTKRKVREALGVWGSITLEQARTAARARLGDVARGSTSSPSGTAGRPRRRRSAPRRRSPWISSSTNGRRCTWRNGGRGTPQRRLAPSTTPSPIT